MPDQTAEDFVRLTTLYAPENITALAFSPDGALLAIATADKVHVYQVPQWARPANSGAPLPGSQPSSI